MAHASAAEQVLGDDTMVQTITKYQDGWPGSLLEHVESCQAHRIKTFSYGKRYQVLLGKDILYRPSDICLKEPKGKCFKFHMALVRGDDHKAKTIARLFPEVMTTKAVECAARHGRLEILEMLVQAGCKCSTRSLIKAASHGHLDVVRYLVEVCKVPCKTKTIRDAVDNGQLEVVQYLYAVCPGVDLDDSLELAAMRGELELVKFLTEVCHEECTEEGIRCAVVSGRLDILEYLTKRRPNSEINFAVYAARDNYEDMIDHFLANRPECLDESVTKIACHHGNVNIAKKLLPRFGTSSDTLETIYFFEDRETEYLEIVKLLLDHGTVPSAQTLQSAVRAGYMSIIQLLHETGRQEMSADTLDVAVESGRLDVVKFVQAHCTGGTSTATMDSAATDGHLDILEYLHKNRSEGCSTTAMDDAAANGHLDVVRFLHTHRHEGCTTEAMDQAATNGHLDVVKYLHEHRQEGCTTRALDGSAVNWHVEVVEFLVKNRSEGCTRKALMSSSKAIQKLLEDATVDEEEEVDSCDSGFYSTESEEDIESDEDSDED